MKRTICPYCGSLSSELVGSDLYYCLGCGTKYDKEDEKFEKIRHTLSRYLDKTDENNPLHCEVSVGEEEAQGLSSLELPVVVSVFKDKYGTIRLNVYGVDKPKSFDDFTLREVEDILHEVKSLNK